MEILWQGYKNANVNLKQSAIHTTFISLCWLKIVNWATASKLLQEPLSGTVVFVINVVDF